MAKRICGHCLAENDGNNKYCVFCGAPMDEREPESKGFTSDMYERESYERGGRTDAGGEEIIYTSVAPRSIVLCVILTIVTFGIYGLIWMCRLNNDVNELAQDPIAPSGGMVVFLTIITLGIYGLFWLYKMGQKCDEIRQINASSGVLFIILGIFGLSIVAYALIQDAINKVLE